MGFDSVTKFLDDFDISKLLPDLNSMLGRLDMVLRILVLLAPLVILGLGLLYFLTPAKEANHSYGYRFYWGMSSVESWQFTQKLAGAVWSVLGFLLLVIMAILCSSFQGMQAMPMVEKAIKCLFWELGIIVVSCIAIDIAVIVFFDSKGVRRKPASSGNSQAKKKPAPQEEAYDEYEDEYYEDEYAQDEFYDGGYLQPEDEGNGFYRPN